MYSKLHSQTDIYPIVTHQCRADSVENILIGPTRAGHQYVDTADFVLEFFRDLANGIAIQQITLIRRYNRACLRFSSAFRSDPRDCAMLQSQIGIYLLRGFDIFIHTNHRASTSREFFNKGLAQGRWGTGDLS